MHTKTYSESPNCFFPFSSPFPPVFHDEYPDVLFVLCMCGMYAETEYWCESDSEIEQDFNCHQFPPTPFSADRASCSPEREHDQ